MSTDVAVAVTRDELLEHWLGHRRLTRRTIETFPESELFSYRVAPLRTFGEMLQEALNVTLTLRGIAEGDWRWEPEHGDVATKERLLAAWDETDRSIHGWWPKLTRERLLEVEPDHFFGGPAQANLDRLLYLIDNEIHHRAQGYVYLRLLGVEPPAFYER